MSKLFIKQLTNLLITDTDIGYKYISISIGKNWIKRLIRYVHKTKYNTL